MAERGTTSRLWQWLPVALWLGVIALESTDLMSSQHTGSILYAALAALFGPIDPRLFAHFHAALRKVGHFVGYGILALLFFRALRATVANGLARLWLWSLGLTCIVACLDELHQTSLASRTGSFRDVILDTSAGMFVLMVAILRIRRKRSVTA